MVERTGEEQMKGDMTFDEHLALQLQDPEFAAMWAVEKPFSDFAINVWRIREERGLTQQQLAERAGLKQPRVAEIERSDANPTLLTISRIAHALGVTPDRLLLDADRKPAAKPEAASEAASGGLAPPTPRSASTRKSRSRAKA
jgi:transcriptional regulator with XRE-family HTH domain